MVQPHQPPRIFPPDQLVRLIQPVRRRRRMTLGETAQGVTAGWRKSPRQATSRQRGEPLIGRGRRRQCFQPALARCSASCIKHGHPMLCSVTDCSAREGVVETHRGRLAAWQEQVIAKANFVEYERDRLLPLRLRNDDPIYAATDVPLKAARQAAGVLGHGEHIQRGSRVGRPVSWLVNGWTGGPIKSAFVHLHLVSAASGIP
jgi:hypothetical protein